MSISTHKRGGAGRGQGRKVITPAPDTIDSREIITAIRTHLETKPAQKIPVLLARKILVLLEMSDPVTVSDWHGEIL